jgi:IclR family transcriptional regulator, pca regulon regulatory protein
VIEAFQGRHRLSLSEVAKLVDLPKPTVRRTLLTLSQLGYMSSTGRQLELTSRVIALAGAFLSSSPVVELLQPSCERIGGMTNLPTAVAALDDTRAMTVAGFVPSWPPLAEFSAGRRLPLTTVFGLVLLAMMSDADRDPLIAKLAETDPVRPSKYLLHQIARQGFAITDVESSTIPALAVPILRRDSRPFGSLGVRLPSDNPVADGRLQELRHLLISEAASLKSRLV